MYRREDNAIRKGQRRRYLNRRFSDPERNESVNVMENGRFSRTLPLLLLAAWVCAVGWFMWTRANQSLTAPGPDPLSYMQKAKNTWENARQGFPVNPLNVEQPLRPPGTTLISFPFGYDGDHRAFHFRTVFIPYLIWTMAVLLACWPIGGQWRRYGRWAAVGAAILFGANPFFFQFESLSPSIVSWGFMDQALGACAGFAMAAVRRSTLTRSRSLLAIGVCMACFSLMIKPTGSLVLLATGAYFVGRETLRILRTAPSERRRQAALLIFGTTTFLALGGGLSLLSLTSRYFGVGNTEMMKEALRLSNMLNEGIQWWHSVKSLFFYVGIQGLLPAIATLATLTFRAIGRKEDSDRFDLGFLLSMLILGYLQQEFLLGGASLIRYYSPFAFMGLAILIGWASGNWRDIYRFLFGSTARALATVTLALFFGANTQKDIGKEWQSLFGVSVVVKTKEDAEVRLIRWLVERCRATGREPVVFLDVQNVPMHLKTMGSDIRGMIEPETKTFRTIHVFTWKGDPYVDLNQMLWDSDLVLISYEDWMSTAADYREVHASTYDFVNDIRRSSHLLYRLSLEGKVKKVWEDGKLMLFSIPDRRRFLSDFDSAFAGAAWGEAFIKGNGIVNGKAHPFDTLSATIPYPPGDAALAAGEGSLDLFDGQPTGKDTLRASDMLRMQGWLAAKAPKGIPAEAVFVTIDGPDGITRFGNVKQVARPDLVSGFGHSSLLHSGFETRIGLMGMEGAHTLGLAYVKGGRWYRYPGFRRTLLVGTGSRK